MQDEPPAELVGQTDTGSPPGPAHPEEMKGTVTWRLGRFAEVTATGRTTPAGLVSAALLAGAIMIPLAWMIRRRR